MVFLSHVSLFGGYVRAKYQNSPQVSDSGHNPFIRFHFYLVTDLFVELIALCNVISSHTHLLIGGRRAYDYRYLLVSVTHLSSSIAENLYFICAPLIFRHTASKKGF